jgi:hypothetical protein
MLFRTASTILTTKLSETQIENYSFFKKNLYLDKEGI